MNNPDNSNKLLTLSDYFITKRIKRKTWNKNISHLKYSLSLHKEHPRVFELIITSAA